MRNWKGISPELREGEGGRRRRGHGIARDAPAFALEGKTTDGLLRPPERPREREVCAGPVLEVAAEAQKSIQLLAGVSGTAKETRDAAKTTASKEGKTPKGNVKIVSALALTTLIIRLS